MTPQAKYAAKRRKEARENGLVQMPETWISPSASQALKSLEAKGLSRTQAVERGIDLVAKEVK